MTSRLRINPLPMSLCCVWYTRMSQWSKNNTHATHKTGFKRQKVVAKEKMRRKSTYPPPADGLFVAKKCKARWWCNPGASPGWLLALAGDRPFHKLQSFEGNCSVVAQRYSGQSRRRVDGTLGFIGRKIAKTAKGAVFRIRTAPCRAYREPASKIRGNRWKPSGARGAGRLWAVVPLHNFVHV